MVQLLEVIGACSRSHRLLMIVLKEELIFDSSLEVLLGDARLEVDQQGLAEGATQLLEVLHTEMDVFVVGPTERAFEGKNIGNFEFLAEHRPRGALTHIHGQEAAVLK